MKISVIRDILIFQFYGHIKNMLSYILTQNIDDIKINEKFENIRKKKL